MPKKKTRHIGQPNQGHQFARPLTPLFLMAALALGLMALMNIPREEEPQISVPIVDVSLHAPGLSATDVVGASFQTTRRNIQSHPRGRACL